MAILIHYWANYIEMVKYVVVRKCIAFCYIDRVLKFLYDVSFSLLRSCCLAKITTMRFNVLKLDMILLYLFWSWYT